MSQASIAESSFANAVAKPIAGIMAVCQQDGIAALLRKGLFLGGG